MAKGPNRPRTRRARRDLGHCSDCGVPLHSDNMHNFKRPFHVGSFGKSGKVKLTKNDDQGVVVGWHVFAWHPITGSATYSSLASLAIN